MEDKVSGLEYIRVLRIFVSFSYNCCLCIKDEKPHANIHQSETIPVQRIFKDYLYLLIHQLFNDFINEYVVYPNKTST